MSSNLTNEEKKKISSERQKAVRDAWKEEKARVANGKGTRNWSPAEQKELMDKGSVSGYDGHHMKSVSKYPDQAGNPKNIQFLTEDEHFQGAHQGSYHNATNGYYDPETKTMNEFNGDELIEIPENSLSFSDNNSQVSDIDAARQDYIETAEETFDDSQSNLETDLDDAQSDYESLDTESQSNSSSSDADSSSESDGMGR